MYQSAFHQIDSISRIGYIMEKVIMHRLPHSGVMHNIMRIYMDKMYSKHIITKFWVFDGITNNKESTFMIATQYRSFYHDITVTTSMPPNPKHVTPLMMKRFESLFDWKSSLSFQIAENPEVIKTWCKNRGKMSIGRPCISYYMDIKTAIALDPKPVSGYHLNMLYSRDGNELAKLWPPMTGTAAYMIDCIETFNGIGIYQDRNRVCSVLNSTSGLLFALQVHEAHRGKGIGEWALILMTILIASKNIYPVAYVFENDMVSRHVFEKVGFKKEIEPITEIQYNLQVTPSQN